MKGISAVIVHRQEVRTAGNEVLQERRTRRLGRHPEFTPGIVRLWVGVIVDSLTAARESMVDTVDGRIQTQRIPTGGKEERPPLGILPLEIQPIAQEVEYGLDEGTVFEHGMDHAAQTICVGILGFVLEGILVLAFIISKPTFILPGRSNPFIAQRLFQYPPASDVSIPDIPELV